MNCRIIIPLRETPGSKREDLEATIDKPLSAIHLVAKQKGWKLSEVGGTSSGALFLQYCSNHFEP